MLVYVNMLSPGQGHFWPKGYNLNNLGRGPLNEATYQVLKTWALVSVKKTFKGFPYVSLCKTCWPLGGANFGPRATI